MGDIPGSALRLLRRIDEEWDRLTDEELERAEAWADETLR